jgi:lipid A oxidase
MKLLNITPAKLLPLLITGLLSATTAHAELVVSIYGGKSVTEDGDLTLKQDKTNLTYKDIRWDDHSFEEPSYYGAKLGYWFDKKPNWGVSLDFTHLKNYLVDSDKKTRTGTGSDGSAVNTTGTINNGQKYYMGDCSEGTPQTCSPLSQFNMSHGVNTVTFNGHYRWFPAGQRDNTALGRLQFYSGFGAGFSVPHVEARVYGKKTYEYQWGAGPVVNGMLGVNYDIYKMISAFGEYKLTYVSVDDDLIGGGTITTETVNHQFIFGLSARFDL